MQVLLKQKEKKKGVNMADILIADDGKPIQILYIMGTGRSATTIQEILLANNPDVVGLGEATHIFVDGMIKKIECSCGSTVDQCELWSRIISYCSWQDNNALTLAETFSSVASHARFFFLLFGFYSNKKKHSFALENEKLFKAACLVSGAHYVVDSSKHAGRCLMLARLYPQSIRVVCITRRPEGLLSAFRKTSTSMARDEQKPKSSPATLLYYMYTLLCFRSMLAFSNVRSVCLKYESLRKEPEKNLLKVEGSLDLHGLFRQSREKLRDGSLLEVGHIVTGNRLRKKGQVVFELQSKEKSLMLTPSERLCASLMNVWRKLLGF